MHRWRGGLLVLGLLLFATAMVVPAPGVAASVSSAAQQVTAGNAMYPRLIRLAHSGLSYNGRILMSETSFAGGPHAAILQSSDDGQSFQVLGRIDDAGGGSGACCGTLFELPAQVGALDAGTLLWAGSSGRRAGRGSAIRVWASRDHGMHWSYMSDCARNPGAAGLWEPELSRIKGGRIACYFGDGTQSPAHSQVIAMTTSADGVHWSPRSTVVATARSGERPGMPVVRRLSGGRYFMSYENCNVPHYFCGGYWRTSPDGRHWGAPGAYGKKIATADGHYFQHAQTITVVPGGPNGTRIVSVGQVYVDAAGHPAAGNGNTILINDKLGAGPWYPARAPVSVAHPHDAPCPNYSSALLPTHRARSLLEIATRPMAAGGCRAYYATGDI